MSAATIRLQDVRLALVCAKSNRDGILDGMARFAAVSEAPLQADCYSPPGLRAVYRERAARGLMSPVRFTPMFRGDIHRVYDRARREHGLAEVRKTWHTGLRALRAEPYCLKAAA